MKDKVALILLSGGNGSRYNSPLPKQYVDLGGKPVIRHSFELFLQVEAIDEIVVVCHDEYRSFFEGASKPITFAKPGLRRQDSVYNGLAAVKAKDGYICIHDGARPFVDQGMFDRVLEKAKVAGAATAAMPLSATIKECMPDGLVIFTPSRERFWEIQTPQIIRRDLLEKGFLYAIENELTVTDDTSLVELIGHHVHVVKGSTTNLKLSYASDLLVAESYLKQNR